MATKRKSTSSLVKAAKARVTRAKRRPSKRHAAPPSAVLLEVRRGAKAQLRDLKLAGTCDERIAAATAALETAGALQLSRDRGSVELAAKLRAAGTKAIRLCLKR